MDRQQFIILTAIALFAAFLIGWLASWLVQRLARGSRDDLTALDSLAQALHEAEEGKAAAVEELERREAELTRRLHGAEAEAQAAMDGLRDARTEIEELRTYIERKLSRSQGTRHDR